MNKEGILAMEAGRELDVLVANEIFDIEVEWDYSSWDINKVSSKQPFYKNEPRTCLGPMAHSVANTICNYSTDISAAWRVFEETDFDVVWRLLRIPAEKNRYRVGYARGEMNDLICYTRNRNPEDCLSPICDSFPEAICKVALLAKLEGGDAYKK